MCATSCRVVAMLCSVHCVYLSVLLQFSSSLLSVYSFWQKVGKQSKHCDSVVIFLTFPLSFFFFPYIRLSFFLTLFFWLFNAKNINEMKPLHLSIVLWREWIVTSTIINLSWWSSLYTVMLNWFWSCCYIFLIIIHL